MQQYSEINYLVLCFDFSLSDFNKVILLFY